MNEPDNKVNEFLHEFLILLKKQEFLSIELRLYMVSDVMKILTDHGFLGKPKFFDRSAYVEERIERIFEEEEIRRSS